MTFADKIQLLKLINVVECKWYDIENIPKLHIFQTKYVSKVGSTVNKCVCVCVSISHANFKVEEVWWCCFNNGNPDDDDKTDWWFDLIDKHLGGSEEKESFFMWNKRWRFSTRPAVF